MRSRISKLLLFSALFFAFSVFVTVDALFAPFAREGASIVLENYCGRPYGELSFAPYLDVKLEYSYDADTPQGVVISQSPKGGSRRKLSHASPSCEVTLTVSLGEETAILPNLIGMEDRSAEQLLRDIGLAVQIERSYGAYPDGTVFETDPQAGVKLPVGSIVTLYVSRGQPAKSVKVPDLRGLSRSDALVALWLSGLKVGEVIEEASLEESGRVIRQSLQAGTLVALGSTVTLYVSAEGVQ